MVWKHIFFICFFPRKTQQNTICRTAPVYKGNEKHDFTLSSPFLWRTIAPYQTQAAVLKLQDPPAHVPTPPYPWFQTHVMRCNRLPNFPKLQLVLYTKHAILQDHLNVNVLDAPHIPPWLLHRAHFDLSMTHLPYLQNPHVTVTTVLSHLHDNYSEVYTDASKTTHRTGMSTIG